MELRPAPARPPDDDTPLEIVALQVQGYRRMTPHRRLELAFDLSFAVRQLALLDVRRRHPGASPRELQLRLASRWLPASVMRAAFGWDPEKEGY